MSQQLQLNFSGQELRDQGIERAMENADRTYFGWSEQAFSFLTTYIRVRSIFLAEDIRSASEGIVPPPPSERAWGGVIVQAKKKGLIERIGYAPVTNPRAHRTPASVWRVVNFKPQK